MGMARTYVASARGIDAISINPAALGLAERGSVSISLFSIGARIGTDMLNRDTYEAYFTGIDTGGTERAAVTLTESDKKRILEAFRNDVGRANFDVNLRPLAISFFHPVLGGVGLAVHEKVGFNLFLDADYVRFLLEGNAPGSRYSFTDSRLSSWWVREYSISYGRQVGSMRNNIRVAAGAAFKLVHGFGYFAIEKEGSYFETTESNVLVGRSEYLSKRAGVEFLDPDAESSFELFPHPAGTGFGTDIGFTVALENYLVVGVAVTDIGSIRWRQNTRETVSAADVRIDDPASDTQQDLLEDALEGQTREIPPFTTQLPTAIGFGMSLQVDKLPMRRVVPGRLLVELNYNQGFNDMPGNTKSPRFSLGMEYKPVGVVALRSGVSVGGTDGFNWALGLGLALGFFDLDIATEHVTALLTPNSFQRTSLAVGARIRI